MGVEPVPRGHVHVRQRHHHNRPLSPYLDHARKALAHRADYLERLQRSLVGEIGPDRHW